MHHDNGMAGTGLGMTAKKRQAASAVARLRRMYIDCRYGQMHLTTAYPASGGFDEATPLVFLHADEGSGADFNGCAALLGTGRRLLDRPPARTMTSSKNAPLQAPHRI